MSARVSPRAAPRALCWTDLRGIRTNRHKITDMDLPARLAVPNTPAYDGPPVFRPSARPQRPVGVIHEVQIR